MHGGAILNQGSRGCVAICPLTHTDPKAYWGALAVAIAASASRSAQDIDGERYYTQLADALSSEEASEFLDLIRAAVTRCRQQQSTRDFAASLGLERGVSGYVYHTVPVVIHAWLSSPNDFQKALLSMIACGGDTDTTGAILGGIIGCRVGKQGIPDEWLDRLWEWPRSVIWMERLGQQLAESETTQALRLPVWGILGRNLIFVCIVLFHGFRRLFPPY